MSGRPRQDVPLIAFLHIPKAGGTTLQGVIRRQYRTDEVVEEYASPITEDEREALPIFLNGPCEYLQLPAFRRSRVKVIMGHFGFGVHKRVDRPVDYFTMLRNPVDRVISSYYHVRRQVTHRFHSQVSQMNLDEYVQSKLNVDVDNGQTRRLAFEDSDISRMCANKCGRPEYEKAVEHLESSFAAIGITERFDESLLVLKDALQWSSSPLYRRENVGDNRPKELSLSSSSRDYIMEMNSIDLALYDYANKALDAVLAKQPGFAASLAEFREQNEAFQAQPAATGTLSKLKTVPRKIGLDFFRRRSS